MARIKSFYMKNLSQPTGEKGERTRLGVLYNNGAKAGRFLVNEAGNIEDFFIRADFKAIWEDDTRTFYQEHKKRKAVSPEHFFLQAFIDLIELEKSYRRQVKEGKPYLVTYKELVVLVKEDQTVKQPTGRTVLLRTDEEQEIQKFEETELSDMLFERKVYRSEGDFVLA